MGLDNIFLSPALGFLFAIHSDWVEIFNFDLAIFAMLKQFIRGHGFSIVCTFKTFRCKEKEIQGNL